MRIGFFTDFYLPHADGTSICIEALRVSLEEFGHTVFVFAPMRPEPFVEPSERIYRFRSIPSLWYSEYRDTFPLLPKHLRLIRSLKLDVIHTFTQAQMGILGMYAAHENRTPLVSTCNVDMDLVKEYWYFLLGILPGIITTSIAARSLISLGKIHQLLLPGYFPDELTLRLAKGAFAYYLNQCDLVTVQSEKIKKDLGPYIKVPLTILPVGIDLRLVPKNPDVKAIRDQLRLPQKATFFVSSSRLVKEKRIDFLLRAFAHIAKEDKQKSALVIVGGGGEAGYLKQLAVELGIKDSVVFTGLVNHKEVLNIVAACDIYVHASLRETQGLVLNEAAACGKPIIMIDREVNPVLQEGKNGLFSSDTIADFSRKMRLLLDNKKMRLEYGEYSKKLAKYASQDIISRQLEHMYQQLVPDSMKSAPMEN